MLECQDLSFLPITRSPSPNSQRRGRKRQSNWRQKANHSNLLATLSWPFLRISVPWSMVYRRCLPQKRARGSKTSLSLYQRHHIDCGEMRFPQSLRPFRLLRQDWHNLRIRYASDWTVFNQLVVASAVYVFFTNLLPGITFASDLYVLTGKSWGTIEVVFSTGLCGVIFSLWVRTFLSSPRITLIKGNISKKEQSS